MIKNKPRPLKKRTLTSSIDSATITKNGNHIYVAERILSAAEAEKHGKWLLKAAKWVRAHRRKLGMVPMLLLFIGLSGCASLPQSLEFPEYTARVDNFRVCFENTVAGILGDQETRSWGIERVCERKDWNTKPQLAGGRR